MFSKQSEDKELRNLCVICCKRVPDYLSDGMYRFVRCGENVCWTTLAPIFPGEWYGELSVDPRDYL